jgi:hypothetical protein
MLIRRPTWPSLLQSYLDQCRQRPFAYGTWDCALFVADAIQSMTGTDLASFFRSRYTCRREAVAAIAKYCGNTSIQSVAVAIAQEHRMPEIDIRMAGRGDMLLIRRAQGRDYSLGLVSLNGQKALIALRVGIGEIPLTSVCRAWRV